MTRCVHEEMCNSKSPGGDEATPTLGDFLLFRITRTAVSSTAIPSARRRVAPPNGPAHTNMFFTSLDCCCVLSMVAMGDGFGREVAVSGNAEGIGDGEAMEDVVGIGDGEAMEDVVGIGDREAMEDVVGIGDKNDVPKEVVDKAEVKTLLVITMVTVMEDACDDERLMRELIGNGGILEDGATAVFVAILVLSPAGGVVVVEGVVEGVVDTVAREATMETKKGVVGAKEAVDGANEGVDGVEEGVVGAEEGVVFVEEAVVGVEVGAVGAEEGVVGVEEGVVGVEEGAVGAEEGVVGAEEGVVGAEEGVVGAEEGVVGAEEGVVGAEEGAVGAEEGVVFVEEGVVGVEEGVVGAEEGVVGVEEGAVGAEEGVVGAEEGVVGAEEGVVGAEEGVVFVEEAVVGAEEGVVGAEEGVVFIEEVVIGAEEGVVFVEEAVVGVIDFCNELTTGIEDIKTEEVRRGEEDDVAITMVLGLRTEPEVDRSVVELALVVFPELDITEVAGRAAEEVLPVVEVEMRTVAVLAAADVAWELDTAAAATGAQRSAHVGGKHVHDQTNT